MERIGIHAARAKLSELIDRVQSGEEVVLTRHGEPVARLVPEKPRRKRSRAAAVARIRALARKLDIREGTDMSRRKIGQEIIQGLEEIKAWRRGELKLKTYTVEMPRAADVPGIRKELGLSQPEFAGFMGVSLGTVRNWEQERREPQGPARALLLVASKQPAAVRAAFETAKPALRTGTHKMTRKRIPASTRAKRVA